MTNQDTLVRKFDHCNFCGKPADQVNNLVSGQNAAICEQCLMGAVATVLKDIKVAEGLEYQQFEMSRKLNLHLAIMAILLGIGIATIAFFSIFKI
ncbi:MAG: ClpX C4-type zinc finger protein [Chitinophagaceae bacterium]|nr:ClpX C4-type zinc finger protein [Chitinophagaceae bacterium]